MEEEWLLYDKKKLMGQSLKVRKHMDGLRLGDLPRMHHCDPGNIEHLYLVTFTFQQLFSL